MKILGPYLSEEEIFQNGRTNKEETANYFSKVFNTAK